MVNIQYNQELRTNIFFNKINDLLALEKIMRKTRKKG